MCLNLYRKSWSQNGDKGIKRLFTPEIKRLLKDWLVRRRENPYPSREEKKILAVDTGAFTHFFNHSKAHAGSCFRAYIHSDLQLVCELEAKVEEHKQSKEIMGEFN